jgi:hypothetical protein
MIPLIGVSSLGGDCVACNVPRRFHEILISNRQKCLHINQSSTFVWHTNLMLRSTRRSTLLLSAVTAGAKALGLILAPGNAEAAEGKPEEAGEPLVAELTNVVLPIVRNGALVNYMFVTLKIRMTDLNAATYVREQHFFVRDGITRATGRNPIPEGKGPNTFDQAAIIRTVTQVVAAMKPGLRVSRVTLEQVAFMRR